MSEQSAAQTLKLKKNKNVNTKKSFFIILYDKAYLVNLWLMSMKKIIFLVIIMLLAMSYAQAQRFEKDKKTDFFIPDTIDFNAPEKIPAKIRKTMPLPEAEEDDLNDENLYEPNNVPFYKFKYDEYINDIMAYYSSDEMPKNPVLEKDLAEMNSEEPIEITAPAPDKLTSYEMGEFYKLYKNILNN